MSNFRPSTPELKSESDRRFTRNHRLLHAKDFESAFKSCWKCFKGPLVLRAHRRKKGSFVPELTARLGLAISKKVLPRAIDRNEVKRRCRNYFRLHRQSQWEGWDFVVSLNFKCKSQIKSSKGVLVDLPLSELWGAWEARWLTPHSNAAGS